MIKHRKILDEKKNNSRNIFSVLPKNPASEHGVIEIFQKKYSYENALVHMNPENIMEKKVMNLSEKEFHYKLEFLELFRKFPKSYRNSTLLLAHGCSNPISTENMNVACCHNVAVIERRKNVEKKTFNFT